MDEQAVGSELVLVEAQEVELTSEVTLVEKKAMDIVIVNDDDFAFAGQAARDVKSAQKKVEAFWEPMREKTYSAYKAVTDNKKAMLDPLKKAESILKKKMSDYQVEKEKKRREEEERIRRLAQEEVEKKLAEAAEAEANGDLFGAEFAMTEAQVMETMGNSAVVASTKTKVDGIAQTKTWAIKSIDLAKLPCEFGGVIIRPADEKMIMQLIKNSKGQVKIPGVEFEETVNISVRAS